MAIAARGLDDPNPDRFGWLLHRHAKAATVQIDIERDLLIVAKVSVAKRVRHELGRGQAYVGEVRPPGEVDQPFV